MGRVGGVRSGLAGSRFAQGLASLGDASAAGRTGAGIEAPWALRAFDELELIVHVPIFNQGCDSAIPRWSRRAADVSLPQLAKPWPAPS